MILSFLLVFWKSHRLSFDHIHVLCTIPPGPLPPQACACHLTLCFFFYCFVSTRQVQFMLPIGSWTRGLHWNMAGCTLKGNWLSLPQWLSVANNFLGRGEVSPQLSCFMLGCGLTWACTGLMHAFTVTESADVHLPCCEGRHVSCNHPSLLVLTLFCFLLWTDPWSLGEGSVVQMSHFLAEHSDASCSLHLDQLKVAVLSSTAKMKQNTMKSIFHEGQRFIIALKN